jgi:hypothetical protein
VYDGVVYRRESEFGFMDAFDIVIHWRNIEMLGQISVKARKCLLDLHDLFLPPLVTDRVRANVSKFMVKSAFHAKLLGDKVPASQYSIIPNGGAYEYATETKDTSVKKDPLRQVKDPNYIIYSSSYDRGLGFMLKWGWPKIKKECPNAYLKIFYGWDGYDKNHEDTEVTRNFKTVMNGLMSQDGVQECGRISHEELMREKQKASVHWYVGDFQEIDCISVRESACAGAIPVVSDDVFVFREKSYVFRIPGNTHTEETQVRGAEKVIDILKNRDMYLQEMILPENETWEAVANRWVENF